MSEKTVISEADNSATQLVARNWEGAREMFVTGFPRPSYDEVGERFGIPAGTIRRVAAQQSWVDLRNNRSEELLKKAEANAILARTIKEVHPAPAMLGEVIVDLLSKLTAAVEKLEKDPSAARKEMDICNTASFAVLNISNALKNAGILGFDALLKKHGAEAGGVDGHGKWDKGLLQQINVTVQGMTARAEAASVPVVSEPIQAKPADDAPPL